MKFVYPSFFVQVFSVAERWLVSTLGWF